MFPTGKSGGGGGGGSGGAGGKPGPGGTAGGGSFGIFLYNASPIVMGNVISTTGGGGGGAGEVGGQGGIGGFGGFSCTPTSQRACGGRGGRGGDGGLGGPGGGGGGGASCGIYKAGSSSPFALTNAFSVLDHIGPAFFNRDLIGPGGLGGPPNGETGISCENGPATTFFHLPPKTNFVQPQQTVTTSTTLQSQQSSATFKSTWKGSDVEMTLHAPSGRIIDRDTTAADVFHENGTTFEFYRIENPEPGEWTIELLGADVPEEGEEVTLEVTGTPVNQPPVADAGSDQTVESTSFAGASVTLNGAGSDPDGDALSFEWTDDAAAVVGTSPPLTLTIPIGTHTLTLTVDDGRGGTDTDSATVTVEDTVPPIIESMTASPNVLWPPNHKMVPVAMSVSVSDLADAAPSCQITSVSTFDGLGNNWKITGDLTVKLRAERGGNGTGRIYLVTVECTDASGNTSEDAVTIIVPHDQGKKKKKK